MSDTSQTDDRFYEALPAFEEFDRVAEDSALTPAPDGWHVVISDIRGSTKAIGDGRYKDVNMVGAACITAATNAATAAGLKIPYCFGGDGATLLVPDRLIATIRGALAGAAALARREFGFELRIGSVPVTELRSAGLDVRIGKLQLSPGNELAMLGGGGIAEADRLIKADPEEGGRYRVALSDADEEPDMSGLSCRWEPLKAKRGVMLCMMTQALSADPDQRRETYLGVLRDVEDVLGGGLKSASPVTPETMRFKWIPKGLRMEARITRGSQPTWRRYAYLVFESLVQLFLERFDKSAGAYDAPVYREELRANSDYRRFDDVMRLVLDCTQAHADTLVAKLEERRGRGELAYGVHMADHALMTCLVFNLGQGEHVHFIDGGSGGFTLASRGFKKQLAEKN